MEQDIADFAYYPPDCNMWEVDIDYYDALVAGFEEQCKGQEECTFTWNLSDLPPAQCSYWLANDDTIWRFMMIASCSDSSINYFNDLKVTKNLIGLVVVFFDLIITFFFWCSLMALKKFQDVTE